MVLLLLLAFALGAAGLNFDIVWVDEMYGLGNMGAFDPPFSPMEVIASLAEWSPDQAPLYFVLASQWARLVGWSQLPMRYFSLLFGVLQIAWTYRLAVEIFDRRTALAAAFLLSTNALVIWYFHEMRMYTLWPMLILVHIWIYWRLVSGRRASRWTWLAFVISAAAAMYTQVFSIFTFAGLGVHHLLFARKSPNWRGIMLGWAFGAFLFLPQLPVFLDGFVGYASENSNARKVAISTFEVVSRLGHVLANDIILLWLPIAALGSLTLAWRKDRAAWRLFTIAAIAAGGIVVANSVFPVISPTRVRYFVAVIPLFAILTARFLFVVSKWTLVGLPFLAIWAVGAFLILFGGRSSDFFGHAALRMNHPPLHKFADVLQGRVRPHDYLLGFAGSPMIHWRYKHGWTTAEWYSQGLLGIDGDFVNMRLSGTELLGDLDRRLDDQPYILLAYDTSDIPRDFDVVLGSIQAKYTACEIVVDADGIFVQRYVNRLIECDRDYSPIHYDNGIRIVNKFATYDAANQSVQVVTGWEVDDDQLLEQYNFSIQLITPNWEMQRQFDRHLYASVLKWHIADISTEGLAPGDYRAVIIVYDRYSASTKVNGIDLVSGEAGTILPLLHFTIEE